MAYNVIVVNVGQDKFTYFSQIILASAYETRHEITYLRTFGIFNINGFELLPWIYQMMSKFGENYRANAECHFHQILRNLCEMLKTSYGEMSTCPKVHYLVARLVVSY